MKTTPTILMNTNTDTTTQAPSPSPAPLPALPHRAPASWSAAARCRCSFALLIALVLGGVLPRAQAGPPEAMTYQGFLVDANGIPLATNNPANYPVIFRIFGAPTGGASLWSEQQIVTVDKGNFSVLLSEGTPVAGEPKPLLSTVMSTNGADRYIQLSVTIGAAPPADMLPRLRLLPAPYAFLSTSANSLVSAAGVPVITYANNRTEINGPLNASGIISGNGSGLTGLTASQIPSLNASTLGSGTLADARLSANVALRAGGNAFTGNQTIGGNLGLGTLNAVFPLTVGNNTLGDKISLWGQSGNSYGFGLQGGLLQIHTDGVAGDIAFGYGSSAAMTETMRIKGDGRVGIGNAAPGRLLNLGSTSIPNSEGMIRLESRSGAGGANRIWDFGVPQTGENTSGIGYSFVIDDAQLAGAEFMVQWGTGRVGIGDNSPSGKLTVNGGVRARGGAPGGNGVNDNGYAFTGNGGDNDSGMYSSSDGQVEFYANAGERMRIATSGNIGINTTFPQDRLHVGNGGAMRLDDGLGRYIRMYRSTDGFIIAGNSMYHNGFSQILWNGDGNWDQSSDVTLKQDIAPAEPVLDRLMQLPVRRYRWKDRPADAPKSFGVVAQEVKPLFPDVVGSMLREGDTHRTMTVKYGMFGLLAAKAVQELKVEQDADNAALKQEIAALQQAVADLKRQLAGTPNAASLQRELDGLKEVVQQLAADRRTTKSAAARAEATSPASGPATAAVETVASR